MAQHTETFLMIGSTIEWIDENAMKIADIGDIFLTTALLFLKILLIIHFLLD